MELTVLGCGGFMPYPGQAVPAFLLRRQGTSYLLDAGEGTQLRMVEAGLSRTALEAIFISHMHGDHTLGLPGVLIRRGQEGCEDPLHIVGPPQLENYVHSFQENSLFNLRYELRFVPLRGAELHTFSQVWVGTAQLEHRIETFGFVLCARGRKRKFHPDKARALGIPCGPLWGKLQKGQEIVLDDGRVVKPGEVSDPPPRGPKIVYITDTRPVFDYPKSFYEPDLLIHEAMFLEKHRHHAEKKYHATALEAARVASHLKAGKLLLTHRSRRYNNPDLLRKEAAAEFSEVELARDGMQIEV
ncbi:MAG: ribonuclease Z [bacterium]